MQSSKYTAIYTYLRSSKRWRLIGDLIDDNCAMVQANRFYKEVGNSLEPVYFGTLPYCSVRCKYLSEETEGIKIQFLEIKEKSFFLNIDIYQISMYPVFAINTATILMHIEVWTSLVSSVSISLSINIFGIAHRMILIKVSHSSLCWRNMPEASY